MAQNRERSDIFDFQLKRRAFEEFILEEAGQNPTIAADLIFTMATKDNTFVEAIQSQHKALLGISNAPKLHPVIMSKDGDRVMRDTRTYVALFLEKIRNN